MLDRQTPNIQIIADRPDDVNNEATMHTNRQAQAHEHKGDLVDVVAQSARPAKADVALQEGSEGVGHAVDERVDEDVAAREAGLGKVGDNHAADGVGVDETRVEDEWDQMLAEDHGLEEEVHGDEGPWSEKRKETVQGVAAPLASGTAGLHDVERAVQVLAKCRCYALRDMRQRDLPGNSVED